jgi:hypothetical protein
MLWVTIRLRCPSATLIIATGPLIVRKQLAAVIKFVTAKLIVV